MANPGEEVATIAALLDSDVVDTPEADEPGGGPIDVLICTHGRRDVCCGKFGTALALRAEKVLRGTGVRIRRTSHLGGHRFAPTALVLPEGTLWAFADDDLLVRLIERSGSPI